MKLPLGQRRLLINEKRKRWPITIKHGPCRRNQEKGTAGLITTTPATDERSEGVQQRTIEALKLTAWGLVVMKARLQVAREEA